MLEFTMIVKRFIFLRENKIKNCPLLPKKKITNLIMIYLNQQI